MQLRSGVRGAIAVAVSLIAATVIGAQSGGRSGDEEQSTSGAQPTTQGQASGGGAQPAERPMTNGAKFRAAAAKNWPEVNRREVPLLYVATPGTAGGGAALGHGILVFDARMNYRFVKRIPFPESWNIPAWQDGNVDEIKGIEADAETGLIYLSTLTGLSAFDLVTEKLKWKVLANTNCCDRPSMAPGSKVMYVPNRGGGRKPDNGWIVVDAATGNVITKVVVPEIPTQHNTIMTPDGSHVFMTGTSSKYVGVADTKTHKVVQLVGPFSDVVRPFTINGAGTLVFVNTDDILGFEIGDVRTGKKIHRVEVPLPWTFEQHVGEFTPAHGVAMSPDEKEIWVVDSQRPVLHVFDSTVMPPRYKTDVKLTRRGDPNLYFMADGLLRTGDMHDYAYWVTFGLDGKHVFSSTGDVIDAATKHVVATLKDEFGRPVRSEKIVEVLFRDGKPVKTSDQFGYGEVQAPPTSAR